MAYEAARFVFYIENHSPSYPREPVAWSAWLLVPVSDSYLPLFAAGLLRSEGPHGFERLS